jgi:5-methylcytosine-specific restriction endonuclease McrA
MAPKIHTVREHIAWSYANLARAHAALDQEASSYRKVHHIIRSRLFHGLISGKMAMRSIYDDERVKMLAGGCCSYCGAVDNLTVDHLIPRLGGGPDEADNLVWACRSCNSSKRDSDMLAWMRSKGQFPSLLLLRRYVKMVARYCDRAGLMDEPLVAACSRNLPVRLDLLPSKMPPLPALILWVSPRDPLHGNRSSDGSVETRLPE